MWVHLTPKSGNVKVGKIPVSTTEDRSCPRECPLKNAGCYADYGKLSMHWKKVSGQERGDNWGPFCKRISSFPTDQLWRHNQAGDLPQRKDGRIHRRKLMQLAVAAEHTNGWTYTHYDPTNKDNHESIRRANEIGGLTVNLSSDNLTQADQYVELGIGPVVTLLPLDAPHVGNKTPAGRTITVCPAQTQEEMTCEKCKLCAVGSRKTIVGFLAHGPGKKKVIKE